MTTRKKRVTIYLGTDTPLEYLYDELRRLAPMGQRGRISRSRLIEDAITVAWQDVQANGRDAVIYKTMVTLPDDEQDGASGGRR